MSETKSNDSRLDLGVLLKNINEKIIKDIGRNYAIGHAYFLQYAEKGSDGKMYIDRKKLNKVFKDKIIPLLQEYTDNDWEQMHNILGDKFIDKDNQKITDKLETLELSVEDFEEL